VELGLNFFNGVNAATARPPGGGARFAAGFSATEKARDFVQRPLRGREPDAL
jgi:hypothetical protein